MLDGVSEQSLITQPPGSIAVLTPVFCDWDCVPSFQVDLESSCVSSLVSNWLLVDDATPGVPAVVANSPGKGYSMQAVFLGRNSGHQRAIAVGITRLVDRGASEPIVVMDIDGEDRPQDIDLLWRAHLTSPDSVVVAQRRGRRENIRFKLFYRMYRSAFRVLTGRSLDFGNFVLLPPSAAQRLVLMNELWNHFPAAVMKSGLDIVKVPIDRGSRYHGVSRMNFTALVNHGLAAIAAFIDAVFVRLLVAAGVLFGFFSLAAVAVVAIRLWGTWGVPGWATTALGLILLGLLQLVGLLVVVTFLTLSMRSSSSPPPIQFAQQYITRVEKIS